MHVLSAGDGYKYLLKSVAAGDGNRLLTDPLTRYYAEKGTPPGRWLGSAVADFGDGAIAAGEEVTETQLRLLLGEGCDPVTGHPLGRAWPVYRGVAERIASRTAALDTDLPLGERLAAVSAIEREERERGTRRAVAGYDYTFSVPKSVSVLWGLSDGGTQAMIARAHHAAVAEVLDLMEREVVVTRVGADAGDGSVVHMDVTGIAATAYDHYDSRAGDPQLHTHVVIANKARAVHDGGWRTLAGRPMHQAVVAVSEHYNAVLADHLSRELGLLWEIRRRGERRNPAFELAAVPDALIEEFSRRSHDIEARVEERIAEFRERNGRMPSTRTILRLRAEATLTTRPEKQVRSLAELTEEWRTRAQRRLDESPTAWARAAIVPTSPTTGLRCDDVPLERIDEIGQVVVSVVGEKRATWRRWNLHAEASRQTMPWRFASTTDREAVVGLIVDAAERHSLALTPPESAPTPTAFQRADGTSMFRPKHATLFSAETILGAENRLIALAADHSGPSVGMETVGRVVRRTLPGGARLSGEQSRAVEAIACSGRVVDVLIGPAGTGKTTTLAGLRAAWERRHGPGSVVGLAPSAAAADVLAGDLGIATENTAKWLYEHERGLRLRRGQLVVLDEASLAGTITMARIAAHAEEVGAKLLLAGDPAQLDAIDAGGAFGLIVREHGTPPSLGEVRRFHRPWERTASLGLRLGEPNALDAYLEHDRVQSGEHDEMVDAAYAAWRADCNTGLSSLLIAETSEAVAELNARARVDRIRDGDVDPARPLRLSDGAEASRGDIVLTRRNDRRMAVGRGFVKNGDRWRVTATHRDGSLTVRQERARAWEVRLPAWYVAEHVELGYASTVHRAQGATVDTGHALVDTGRTSRESLYAGMTRGRASNTAYVVLAPANLEEHQQPDEPLGSRDGLLAIITRVAAEPSAHEALRAEQDAWGGIAQLAAEYDTIATAALTDRYLSELRRAGLSDHQLDSLAASETFAPLVSELRRVEAHRIDLTVLLREVIASRTLHDAGDLGAVLYRRLQQHTAGKGRPRRQARLIAGLLPAVTAVTDPEMRSALTERQRLIEQRARDLADTAIRERAPWVRPLGTRPADPGRAQAWLMQLRTIAAYRDRYAVTDASPTGRPARNISQRLDQARAEAAARAAQRIAADRASSTQRTTNRSNPSRSI
jgi:conjugative relaxase-like TrwC/TraI family protein